MKLDKSALSIAAIMALASVISYVSVLAIKNENNFLFLRKDKSNSQLAAVAPHHDLVKDNRRKFIKKLSLESQPRTIILISVNHFNTGRGNIISSDQNWLVANGAKKIIADMAVINKLKDSGLVKIEPTAFIGEHGIRNLLGEIKEFFPNSSLAPLIIKEPAKPDDIQKLFEILESNCPDCGMIASVDMSHYQPAHLAEIHDVKTVRALAALDTKQLWQTETDSNAGLVLLALWAKAKNLTRFNLFVHTNSGLLAQNFEAETTTHILGNYSAGEPAKADNELSFSFAGDGMFGRNVGYYFQKNNFQDLFSNLGNRTLWGTDIAWLNLEGPISDKEIKQNPKDKNLVFNFSRQTIAALKYLKITTAGLANNHTANQSAAGLNKTKEMLEGAQIDWVSDSNKISGQSLKRYRQGDMAVALIAINVLAGVKGAEELIKQEKSKHNFVIILPHWGNEYQITHSAEQEKLARLWLAAGADLIIGSHPHVVQDAQVINGKLVFYSLGNFIFDQMFSAETQQGLILAGTVSAEKLKIVLTPIISKKMKPEIMRGAAKQKIINRICGLLGNYCKGDVIEI